jgi:hypothetical protein
MKNMELTSGETDRKLVELSSIVCKRVGLVCFCSFGALTIYLLSLGPVLRMCNRLPPGADRPRWFLVIYSPALSARFALPVPIRGAYQSYLDWWNTQPRGQ